LRFEIIPGVSSAIAAPAYAGIPVTHREHSSQLTIFTGHEDPTRDERAIDYAKLATQAGTKVMLMGVERIEKIVEETSREWRAGHPPCCAYPLGHHRPPTDFAGTLQSIAEQVVASEFRAPSRCGIW
jgi:uroporphyrinogen III methyltransferase/synthase